MFILSVLGPKWGRRGKSCWPQLFMLDEEVRMSRTGQSPPSYSSWNMVFSPLCSKPRLWSIFSALLVPEPHLPPRNQGWLESGHVNTQDSSHSSQHYRQPKRSAYRVPRRKFDSFQGGLWNRGEVSPKFQVAGRQHLRQTDLGESDSPGNVSPPPTASYGAVRARLPLFPSQDFTGKLICIYLTLPLNPFSSGNLQIYNLGQPSGLIRLSRFSKDHKLLFSLPLLSVRGSHGQEQLISVHPC